MQKDTISKVEDLTGSNTASTLTIDEKKILDMIIGYKRDNDGNAPSYAFLARWGYFASTNTVFGIVTRLVTAGYLSKANNGKLCVKGGKWDTSLQPDVL